MISQRDRLIERYLNGEMSSAEESGFRRELQGDKHLLGMLRTELLIRSTMSRDRGAIPADHSRTRARAMAMLTSLPQSAQPGLAGPGAGTSGLLSGIGAVKGIIGSLAGLAVIAGSYLFLASPDPAPASAPPATTAEAPAATVPEPVRAPQAAEREKQGAPAEQGAPMEHAGATPPRTTPRTASAAQEGSLKRQAVREPAPEKPALRDGEESGTVELQEPSQVKEPIAPPVTIRNDTLRTRLKIESLQRR